MAALAEVEAARRLLVRTCVGGTIMAAYTVNDCQVFMGYKGPAEVQEAMLGKRILSVHRKGVHLCLQLNCPRWVTFEFGMSGAIIVKGVKGPQYKRYNVREEAEEEEFPTAYFKFWLKLDSEVRVALIDKRRSSRIRLLADPERASPLKGLGPDAFLELPDPQVLIRSVQTSKRSIKALLLKQRFIAGIGDWVGDEVLYQAEIHPEQPANSLTEEEVTKLHSAIREVLDTEVFVDADSDQYPPIWLFHHRWNRKLGMFTKSVFVPNVQKYSEPELKGAKTRAAFEEDSSEDSEGMTELHIEPNVNSASEVAVDMDVAVVEKACTSGTPKRSRGLLPNMKGESAAKSLPPTSSPAGATDNASPAG